MSVVVTFACGHQQDAVPGGEPPVCHTCQEHRIRAVKAPNPVFRGLCSGPLVTN